MNLSQVFFFFFFLEVSLNIYIKSLTSVHLSTFWRHSLGAISGIDETHPLDISGRIWIDPQCHWKGLWKMPHSPWMSMVFSFVHRKLTKLKTCARANLPEGGNFCAHRWRLLCFLLLMRVTVRLKHIFYATCAERRNCPCTARHILCIASKAWLHLP